MVRNTHLKIKRYIFLAIIFYLSIFSVSAQNTESYKRGVENNLKLICNTVPDSLIINRILSYMDSVVTTGLQLFDFADVAYELFYPNESKYSNDEYLIPIVQRVVAYNDTDKNKKIRYQLILNDICKNRVGEKVSDFKYLNRDGEIDSLYSSSTEFTLIIFGSTDCNFCKALKKRLISNKMFKNMFTSKLLNIIFINSQRDISFRRWREVFFPEFIISAYDVNGVLTGATFNYKNASHPMFNIKTLPVIYLLDRDKKVLLKEKRIGEIENFLKKNLEN